MKRAITSMALISFIVSVMISCPDPLKTDPPSKLNLTPLHLIIPDGTTEIIADAHQKKGYTSLTIPDSIKAIGDGAFYANKLIRVIIPDSVETIGNYAFADNNLNAVIIPDSVETIGNYAFADNNLNSVIIPDSVETIGDYAFAYNNLSKVILAETLYNKYNKKQRENRFGSEVIYHYLKELNDKKSMLILTMEGGGARGVLQVQFLMYLEQATKKKVFDMFDFFTGTSIGGMHAMFFAVLGAPASELMAFYSQSNFKSIFKMSKNSNPETGGLLGLSLLLETFLGADNVPSREKLLQILYLKHSLTEKNAILHGVFQGIKLKDSKKHFLVPAFKYSGGENAFYFSTHNSTDEFMKDILVADIADAISAAPTYFPLKRMYINGVPIYFMDGSLLSNNICPISITVAVKNGYSLDEIKVLSLGTGSMSGLIDIETAEKLQYASTMTLTSRGKLLEKLVEGPALNAVRTCKKLLGDRFLHIPFNDAPVSDMDKHTPTLITAMKDAAKKAFNVNREKLLKFIKR